ncbi:serpin family protein [Hippea maritima]|uniref:Proteinase inhibitor I4 serpin n=1 Tax=Hippea maritima (strain ATCC 700847 / DSM 10411 / MH2) TaxID=760142 RepID=F2LX34_HIPMA|nr:serpin family protein [Hippea maritima]AEA33092.1 proteinase inhibitor I4 serpin [Hippea maritima DSM 10411]
MRRLLVAVLFIVVFYPRAIARPIHPKLVLLKENTVNLMLIGDRAQIKTGPLDKNVYNISCEVKGKAIVLKERFGSPSFGYSFRFEAISPGSAVVVQRISKFGKGKEKVKTKEYEVRVFSINSIPKVSLNLIAEHPDKYTDRFVLIHGISRGWGGFSKTKRIVDTMLKRSDWVIEDDSAAAYISGVPKVKKGVMVDIVCKVVVRPNGEWALVGHRILEADNTGLNIIANDINRFTLKLYKKLSNNEGNLFFSSFSIVDALAMTYAGASKNTAEQMAKVLNFNMPKERLHSVFSKLLNCIQAETQNNTYKFSIANAIWVEKDYKLLDYFVNLINLYYGGNLFSVDFVNQPQKTINRINKWVEDKTTGKIRDLIRKGDINSLTRLILTNAIYFKGKWTHPFRKEDTKSMPFHITNNKTVRVPMMFQEGRFPYYENKKEGFKAIELPYAGNSISMVIFLPSNLEGFEQALSQNMVARIIASLREDEVKVYLPRFRFKVRCYLSKVLSDMGMRDAFSTRADFSDMTGNKDLKISRVIHEAYIDVNEEGTEAAAATGVVMQLKAVMWKPTFKADHTFIFMIVHKKTGSVLFMGRVIKP